MWSGLGLFLGGFAFLQGAGMSGGSQVLGLVGVALLVLGIVLAMYGFVRFRRRPAGPLEPEDV